MAVHVIDLFKMVYVEHEGRQFCIVPLEPIEFAFTKSHERAAIKGFGERVNCRQLEQITFFLFQLNQVAHRITGGASHTYIVANELSEATEQR